MKLRSEKLPCIADDPSMIITIFCLKSEKVASAYKETVINCKRIGIINFCVLMIQLSYDNFTLYFAVTTPYNKFVNYCNIVHFHKIAKNRSSVTRPQSKTNTNKKKQ